MTTRQHSVTFITTKSGTKRTRIITLAFLAAFTLAGCGGGEDGLNSDSMILLPTTWDESAPSTQTWQPSTTTSTVSGQAATLYVFPLSLHQNGTFSSYVSKVGTTTTVKYSVSGRITTTTVANGTFAGRYESATLYKPSVLFEGTSVTPAESTGKYSSVTINGIAQKDSTSSSVSYYDTTFGVRLGNQSEGVYKVLDTNRSQGFPGLAISGDTGDFFIYNVYSDSTKKSFIGRDVYSYTVKSVSASSSIEYLATVDFIVRKYNGSGVLTQVTTTTQELLYNANSGSKSRTLSIVVDDVAGTTTSRLTFTRI